jgi:hypothetical protein
MPLLSPETQALLDSYDPIKPIYFAFLDLVGDPVRVTTAGFNVTFSSTGDADLDGFTFSAVDPRFIEVGEVSYREGGSETLTCSLSGILGLDSDTLNLLGDRANWQGREARLWKLIRNEAGVQQGAIIPYYTGYCSTVEIQPSPKSQTISLGIEHYLASLTAPSNRTYLSQNRYDAADQSARATMGSTNAGKTGPGGGVVPGGDTAPVVAPGHLVDAER